MESWLCWPSPGYSDWFFRGLKTDFGSVCGRLLLPGAPFPQSADILLENPPPSSLCCLSELIIVGLRLCTFHSPIGWFFHPQEWFCLPRKSSNLHSEGIAPSFTIASSPWRGCAFPHTCNIRAPHLVVFLLYLPSTFSLSLSQGNTSTWEDSSLFLPAYLH